MLVVVGLALPLSALDKKDQVQRLAVGQPMPALTGEYLTGRKAVLPEAAKGKTALLALGFTYDSRFAVEAWVARFRKEFGRSQHLTFYEIPMIGGMARMGRWFIDGGMRRGTPKDLHENVVTVYGGTDPWKRRVAFKNEDDAYLVLLNPGGVVEWLHAGPFDESRFAELASVVRRLDTESSATPVP